MKNKILVCVVAFFAVGLCFAQEKAVKTAKKYYSQQKWSDAAGTIDAAVENPETVNSLDAWMLRGKIYLSIANNPLLARDYPNAAELSKESFERALRIDPSDKTLVILRQNIFDLSGVFVDKGASLFEQQDFEEAVKTFETALAVYQLENEYDTNVVFNIFVSAYNAKQLDKAMEYAKIINASTMASPNVYAMQAELYLQNNRKEEAVSVMKEAIGRFPEDKEVYTASAIVYLRAEMNEDASNVLEEALAKWGNDATFHRFIGMAYENIQQYEKAEASYKQALEINPDYFDAIYSLANFYTEKGKRIDNDANNVPYEENDKYQQLKEQAHQVFEQALPYLQQVVEKQPNNLNVLTVLRDVYVQLGKTEEAKVLREKIEELQGE